MHVPSTHPAKLSQVIVRSFELQGCPSAMIVTGQVPRRSAPA
jgi:hypothetical protein